MKTSKIASLVTAAMGFLIIIVPNWVLPVCDGLLELANGKQVPMRCFWTARAEMTLGGLILIGGLLLTFRSSAETRRRFNQLVTALGLAVILTPLYIIPTCTHPDMACNVGTKPALLLLGAVTLAIGLYASRRVRPTLTPDGP
jgi:hypothetical protein